MINSWKTTSPSPDPKTIYPNIDHDFARLIMHIFSSAGFGVNLEFDESRVDPDSSYFSDNVDYKSLGVTRTYRNALNDIGNHLQEVVAVGLVPSLLCSILPGKFRKYLDLREDLRFYLKQLIKNASKRLKSGGVSTRAIGDDLLSLLVRNSQLATSDAPKKDILTEGKKYEPLSESEILGNAYLFSLAGNETTAINVKLSFVLLAMNPDAQAWLHRNLDENLAGKSEDPNDWPYELYGKLKASLCVMVLLPLVSLLILFFS